MNTSGAAVFSVATAHQKAGLDGDAGPADAGGRRADLQGLRAVAVMLVVGYHAGLPLPGGFVGVDVFFVISGFVITAMLQREWEAHGRIRFGRFYLRRVKRLTPALALMVSVTVVLSALFLSPLGAQQATAQTAVGAMFIVANAVIARTTGDYFDAPAEENALLHTWSLSVEEQFYLVFPVLVAASWLLARRFRVHWLPVVVSAGVGVFSLAVAVVVSRGFEVQAGEMLVGFYGPLTRVWEFAAGAILALAPTVLAPRSRRMSVVLGAAGVLLLMASVVLISGVTPFPGLWTLLPVVGTALLIRSGGRGDHLVARLLRSTPMVKVGDWSYSIYLWHWPLIVFAGALWPREPLAVPLAAVLSLAPAIASYAFVEQPIRQMELSSRRRQWKLVTLSVLPPVLLAVALATAVERGFWSPAVREYQAAVLQAHQGCYVYTPLTTASAAECTWNRGASGPPIYLVGDSHAQHFSEALIATGVALDRPVVVSTGPNCPVLGVTVQSSRRTPDDNSGCRSFAPGTLEYLLGAAPGVVVLSASDSYWTDQVTSVGLTRDSMTANPDLKLAIAPVAIESTVRRLQARGHEVLLVKDTPRWTAPDEWTPAGCTLMSLVTRIGSCEQSMPVERVAERQGRLREVLDQAAVATGAGLLDPWDRLCPDGRCATRGDGLTRYQDTNHITVPQSAAFAGDFRKAIDDLGR